MWRRVLNGHGPERMKNLRLSYAQTVKTVFDFIQQKDIYLNFYTTPVLLDDATSAADKCKTTPNIANESLKLSVVGLF
jgi:hypothetical protein